MVNVVRVVIGMRMISLCLFNVIVLRIRNSDVDVRKLMGCSNSV